MVIEYAGTVIRSVLTDKREKYYDSKVGAGLLLSPAIFIMLKFLGACMCYISRGRGVPPLRFAFAPS